MWAAIWQMNTFFFPKIKKACMEGTSVRLGMDEAFQCKIDLFRRIIEIRGSSPSIARVFSLFTCQIILNVSDVDQTHSDLTNRTFPKQLLLLQQLWKYKINERPCCSASCSVWKLSVKADAVLTWDPSCHYNKCCGKKKSCVIPVV